MEFSMNIEHADYDKYRCNITNIKIYRVCNWLVNNENDWFDMYIFRIKEWETLKLSLYENNMTICMVGIKRIKEQSVIVTW